MKFDRRYLIGKMVAGAGALCLLPHNIFANEPCAVQHPLMPPNKELGGSCHNCGMMRPMWARTWHTYEVDGEALEVCSMHCLAEATVNAGGVPRNIQVALYLSPEKSVPAEQAFYVVGSKARGTMTMTSKLAFATREEAEKFAAACGGDVVTFDAAYQAALPSIAKENGMINKNRVSKGKIVEPVDNKDRCPVCEMYPARYPKNKCQLQTMDGEVVHFCSTYCLFAYLKDPGKYGKPGLKSRFIWVIDFESGQWSYARNAYYVVGSDATGPMGKEAFPFSNRKAAGNFTTAHSGKILRFTEVSFDRIMN
jgi:copper chaperone NosL